MEVQIGNIKARCACGGSDFIAPSEAPLAASDSLACASCGRLLTYAALLDQVGDEAMKQARDSLERLRRERPPTR